MNAARIALVADNDKALVEHLPDGQASLGTVLDDRRHTRIGWWLVLLGFAGFLLWAALAPLDKGVPVSGKVMVSGNRKAVQHASGGIVERILVRDGERVTAGQVLVRLDETAQRAQMESLRAQYVGARSMEGRLSAERDGADQILFAADLLARSDEPLVAASLALQRQLFDSRRQALAMELDGLREGIAGAEEQLRGLRALRQSRTRQKQALEEQLAGLRDLAREGYVARNRLLDSERLYAELDGALAEELGRIGQLQRQILEMRLKFGQRREEYQKEVRSQLAETRTQAEDLRHRLVGAEFELARSQVRAPADGIVVGLNVFTDGGVIAPGQALMEIVPEHEPLLVEGQVPVNLIDKVHPGLPVELIFSAFNQSTTPRIAGEVQTVSADRLVDETTGEPYYNLRARVSEDGMRQLAGLAIRPGMPVEAFVRTGERSLLNYLFKPLLDRTHLALVED
ncbi:HlyD family type I secretion periplasmic adaptor subunit [Pseudomonas lopnurensis]|uniref:HlyD family type I secretion periplasmic adaptor subunit n=1 Tax=Pseudomonas lopnurensis TaxID=1477517 RepID=UPI001879A93C|nr:HlyD family type I secretion periplasmic adaptor subunit [Pseudomonas lopnurensis]MBE7374238.1 HlyD family type I secretion periplasmic adaptor subunit [Pseudomonas lopnurensis]